MARHCTLCNLGFKTRSGYNAHRRTTHLHPKPNPQSPSVYQYHRLLNARPCLPDGTFLPPNTPPPPHCDAVDWNPFPGRPSFEYAELVYDASPQSEEAILQLRQILRAQFVLDGHEDYDPFPQSKPDIEDLIDAIPYGEVPWRTLLVRYRGVVGPDSPSWKRQIFKLHTRDSLRSVETLAGNPEFKDQFDYVPYEEYTGPNCRRVCNLMSGQWAFNKANEIAVDPSTHGCMLTPIILGADKTTVSVATGNQEYHPVYMSLGNIHNTMRRAHRESVIPVAFLPIPKALHEWEDDEEFRLFKKKLYHACLAAVLEPLRPGMEAPGHVLRCPDGHFRRAIFQVGPFIADYPEQVYLSGIVSGWCAKCFAIPNGNFQKGDPRTHQGTSKMCDTYTHAELWDAWGINSDIQPFTKYFPRADIHELLTPDLLHQLIKGTFKDHVVAWVIAYIKQTNPDDEAKAILDDIDRR
ncbi:uncharacterized protein BXZ73DRAFT_108958 [Epithele typhae]|uniref:uncharacterized protein n=1 Tax=Epithele typhae TaxID=378194 RepID=UPI00200740CC|nr:uncharacterized protein BXZ73DRAFT_108958 [Epithele typhae]KAH9910467.1 hypothetical protein BXZ73DRAFT_108958 [Epithele typhae]